jgi:Skp family chaperone for outer membrane proteins
VSAFLNEENRTVKRTVVILVGVATLGVVVYLGSKVWAQQGSPGAARPAAVPIQTKVRVANIGQIIKNYSKFKFYQEAMKKEMEPIQKQVDAKKAQVTAYQNEMQKAETTTARKEQLTKEIKQIERQMGDAVEEANQSFAKKRIDQLVTIYKDVEWAVNAYARAQAIELVLQYSDGVDPAEKYSPASLQQKLGNQACIPIYMQPGMDISNDIVDMLNRQVTGGGSSMSVTPASAGGAPARPQ